MENIEKLNKEEFNEYMRQAYLSFFNNEDWRLGQALFNTLYHMYPEIADSLRGDFMIDPFYNNDNIPAFLKYICEEE